MFFLWRATREKVIDEFEFSQAIAGKKSFRMSSTFKQLISAIVTDCSNA